MLSQHKKNQTFTMILSSLFLALCYILPNFTGNIPVIGSALLPMHLPVLLAGYFCGPFWACAVGFVAPVSRSLLMTMPPMSVAIPMGFELATYGLVSGALYDFAKKQKLPVLHGIYGSLLSAMVAGRVVYGIIKAGMTMGTANPYTFALFVTGTVTSAIPGIILQIVLIPAIVLAMERQADMAREK